MVGIGWTLFCYIFMLHDQVEFVSGYVFWEVFVMRDLVRSGHVSKWPWFISFFNVDLRVLWDVPCRKSENSYLVEYELRALKSMCW